MTAPPADATELSAHFDRFRRHIVGVDAVVRTPDGERPLIYADWTASGRLYGPIERRLSEAIGPFVANTHSEASATGALMTEAYHEAHAIIRRHVNAGKDDVVITAGSGMTAVVNKLIRLLGLRVPEQLARYTQVPDVARPVVFVTHMEHHSNQTPWIETIADVEVLPPDEDGLVNPESLRERLEAYRDRPIKIGAFTACSNVTGIGTPIHTLARLMHEAGGVCFADYAASAPYVPIDMHPGEPGEHLDAVYFSPHKFLGGPGSPGVLVFNAALYTNRVPDQPGGGTVEWTNPWLEHRYITNIEVREDGGTPGFLQAIRAALAIRLKDSLGTDRILQREHGQARRLLRGLGGIAGVHVLAAHVDERLGIVSFYFDRLHYNLVVRLLNDRFGVQARGGCSCAGTYGHYLLHVGRQQSEAITSRIDHGDLSTKPGWVRLSIHPTTPDAEIDVLVEAVDAIARNGGLWAGDYVYSTASNEFHHTRARDEGTTRGWFDLADAGTPPSSDAGRARQPIRNGSSAISSDKTG
ncbi:MAG: selenocysteine lyase [Acidobacteria bacterium RIFCSPLOWO2_02_FULL_67_36]|nr:MAG: selenocysteine lyase [Acidobacteria bacterium RIFCSPLOWO2_02_FULL_67_36]OFW26388.1 MAG: selenocysteine lyase [Acidobacteria bacterium RIFCSPLOWO2_12_FULL_66_21]